MTSADTSFSAILSIVPLIVMVTLGWPVGEIRRVTEFETAARP
jgi:uncharacterized BrkB/YihY/UPF0761 family membrane protein